MWAQCYRSHLPSLGDNTTNRIERTFWSFKNSLADTFGRLPDTSKSIMHILEYANKQLEERYTYTNARSLKIYDANETIRKLNEQASKHLNDRGCTTFHLAQKNLQTFRDNLEVVDGGIRQSFGEGDVKVYKTSDKSCDCTFFSTYQAPCMHILFARDSSNNVVFSPELFHSRYLRNNDIPVTNDEEMVENPGSINSEFEQPVNVDEPDDEDRSLSDRERYSIVMPLLVRLGSVISAHSTKQFLAYISNLEDIEQKVRRGESLVLMNDNNVDLPESPTDIAVEQFSPNENSEQPQSVREKHPPTVPPNGNRFTSITFKEGLKTKGRPKRRNKQLTFKRTQRDQPKSKSAPLKSDSLPIQENVNNSNNIDFTNSTSTNISFPARQYSVIKNEFPTPFSSSYIVSNLTSEQSTSQSTEAFKWPAPIYYNL